MRLHPSAQEASHEDLVELSSRYLDLARKAYGAFLQDDERTHTPEEHLLKAGALASISSGAATLAALIPKETN